MKHGQFAIRLSLAFALGLVQPAHAQTGPSPPLGHFSLSVDGVPGALQAVQPAASMPAPPREASRTAGYAVGFGYNYTRDVSGRVEWRRYDYFVDDNLKAERPRNAALLTMHFRF